MSLLMSEINKFIKKDLGDYLKGFGYKKNSKLKEDFWHPFDGGFYTIGVAVYDYKPKFLISPFVSIRFDVVEDIVQKYIFILPQYKDKTMTINTPYEFFTGVDEFDIRELITLSAWIDSFKGVYVSQIDEFLKTYSNIIMADKAINEQKIRLNYLVEPHNCIRSMIIAKVAGNPNYKSIAKSYLDWYLSDLPDQETPAQEVGWIKSVYEDLIS